ncbi:SDR family NAD(P)-dependent oxidoreductase [Streptomyces sp. NPDC050743]|uniref:SDR family NAD(P)-dependent oxidoreductase n=1 Tax=Streptomyces sp. NPDC050743 TaxID=3365634 RepID=UPI0037B69AD5
MRAAAHPAQLISKDTTREETERQTATTQQFAGKTPLVTGGGSGIGRASALALAAEGALVTVAGRTAETLKETVRLVEAAGGSARHVVADMSDESQVERAVQAAVAEVGPLDFALNNAGYDGEFQLTTDYSTDMLDHMIALNVRGVFLSMKHELRYMVAQGSGSIVNMSSGAGLVGVPGFSGYPATKAAEVAMTKSSALEAAPHGIRINAVCPGLVETPMIEALDAEQRKAVSDGHPLGRIAEPREIADAVIWLCSHKASFVTGIALPVDGGYTVP